jgi:hypothetical protein
LSFSERALVEDAVEEDLPRSRNKRTNKVLATDFLSITALNRVWSDGVWEY